MSVIYHITKVSTWDEAKAKGYYDYCALKSDGFIHCSTLEQTLPTANRFFKGQSDLIVLEIDPEKVKAKVIFEQADDIGEDFPHIYGELNIDAVIKIKELEKDDNNYFNGLKDQVYF